MASEPLSCSDPSELRKQEVIERFRTTPEIQKMMEAATAQHTSGVQGTSWRKVQANARAKRGQ